MHNSSHSIIVQIMTDWHHSPRIVATKKLQCHHELDAQSIRLQFLQFLNRRFNKSTDTPLNG